MRTQWHKGIITWREQDCLCVSVPFTWLLPEARAFALSHPKDRIVAGGPAVRLMPNYASEWAEVETIEPLMPPLRRANSQASRTTFGCPNHCAFCGVRTIEGEYREVVDFEPAPILCDSNFLACSDAHFGRVIDRLKQCNFDEVDFNQALDANLLTDRRAQRLSEVNLKPRLAWDTAADEVPVFAAIERLERAGIKTHGGHLVVFCLVNFGEAVAEAQYRMQTLKDRGYTGFAMRYQPLDALTRNAYLHQNWNAQLLTDFCRYWNRQSWLGGITFGQYREGIAPKYQLALMD